MCRADCIVAKEAANGKKTLPEQILSSSQAGVMGVGVVRPEANAPHQIKRAGFR